MRAALAAILLALAVCARPTPAFAQAKPDAHVAEGRKLLAQKKYDAALSAFESAFATDPAPRTLVGIAECLAGLGRVLDAYESYERALSLPGPPLLPHESRRVEQAMAELAKQTGTVTVRVDPPDSNVQLDGAKLKVPLLAPLRVMPGTHKIVVSAPRHRPFEQSLSVAAGDAATVTAKLAPDATTGVMSVREQSSKPARVMVEGLDAGDTPLRIHAVPGTYRVALSAGGQSTDSRDVDVKLDTPAEVVIAVPEAPVVPPEGSCAADDDCNDGERCRAGKCVARKKPKKTIAGAGESCEELDCDEGLTCHEKVCKKPNDVPPNAREAIGVFWQPMVGLTGLAHYPAPAHVLGAAVEIAAADVVRLHVSVGYANLNGWSGVRAVPVAVGFPFVVYSEAKKQMHVVVEPGIDPFTVMGVFSDTGHLVLFGSAAWVRGSFHYQSYFAALEPVGMQLDFAQVVGNGQTSAATFEGGLQYFARVAFGSHF